MAHQQDNPPKQAKHVPIAVMSTILHHAHTSDNVDNELLAIANVTCIRFFLLCQPGEHLLNTENSPFCLQDATLPQWADTITCENKGTVEMDNDTSVTLTFTTQKISAKGKIICNGMTRICTPVLHWPQCNTCSTTKQCNS